MDEDVSGELTTPCCRLPVLTAPVDTWHNCNCLLLVCLVASCCNTEAAKLGVSITPNTGFLTNYLKGVESGNKRAIARNAARGAQKVCCTARASLLAWCLNCSEPGAPQWLRTAWSQAMESHVTVSCGGPGREGRNSPAILRCLS